jgi:hypothetical protein
MAKKILKEEAISMRMKGFSYSDIKNKIGVSKSTLSLWLRDFPLDETRIKELRDNNPKRIERYRNTMRQKKENRLSEFYKKAEDEVGLFSKRDLLVGGIFLYMGEGSKTTKGTTAVTNTNPKILKLFIKWLNLHNVKKEKIKVQLHLYSDMDPKKQVAFWSKELAIPITQFRKPHIKKSTTDKISYKGQFGQGTCTVLYEDIALHYLTLSYVRYVQENLSNFS